MLILWTGRFAPAAALLIAALTLGAVASCSGKKTAVSSDERTLHLVEALEKERTQFCVENEEAYEMNTAGSAVAARYELSCSDDMLFVRSYLEAACAERGAKAPQHCGLLAVEKSERIVDAIMDIAALRDRPDWRAPEIDRSQGFPAPSGPTTVTARRGNIKVTLTLTSTLLRNQGTEMLEEARWTTKLLGQKLSGKYGVVLPAIRIDVNDVGEILNETKLHLIYRTHDGKLWRLGEWPPVADQKSIHLFAVPRAAKDWEVLKKGGTISLALEAEDPTDNYSIMFSNDGQRAAIEGFLETMPYEESVQSYMSIIAPEKPRDSLWRKLGDRLEQKTRDLLQKLDALSGTGEDLILAAAEGDVSRTAALLKTGVDPNATAVGGVTPLIAASGNGHDDVVTLLLKNGADLSYSDHNGATALIYAAQYGHDDVVRELLNNSGSRILNKKDAEGWTALMCAAERGHRNIVRRLIDKRARLNERQDRGATAIILAAAKGHAPIVRDLLDAGADPYLSTPEGTNALTAAAAYRHKDVVDILTERLAADLR